MMFYLTLLLMLEVVKKHSRLVLTDMEWISWIHTYIFITYLLFGVKEVKEVTPHLLTPHLLISYKKN